MMDLKTKGFNEIFLSEISRFNAEQYAYDVFFNCEDERFSRIGRQYGIKFGYNAQSYMYKTFYSWKSKYVSPNSSSKYNIISSTLATFSHEEKFYTVYTEIAKYIQNKFPSTIKLEEVNSTYSNIIEEINNFNIEKNYRTNYISNIFKNEEEIVYIKFLKQLFIQYTQIIFENINSDVYLIDSLYKKLNTTFIKTRFRLYLFNIELNTKDFDNEKFVPTKVFKNLNTVSIEDLLDDSLTNLSIDNITELAKSNNKTKIDAMLSENQINNIVTQKHQIEQTKKGGSINYSLKTNGGVLNIDIRILSSLEKTLIILRIILFFAGLIGLTIYCFIFTESYWTYFFGLIGLQFLITPIYTDIIKYFKDKLKIRKYGRK